MRNSVILGASVLVGSCLAQSSNTVNTNAITDATASIQTPATVASITTTPATKIPLQTSIIDPVTATAPGATIRQRPNVATIATTTFSSDFIQPSTIALAAAQDLFSQIAFDVPSNVVKGSVANPTSPANVAANYQGVNGLPVATNNFYGNLNSNDPTTPVFVMPYTVYWRRGAGLCAWNTDNSKYVFGSYEGRSNPGPHYYFSPGGNCPIGFGSAEMDANQALTTSNMNHQSVDVTLTPSSKSGSMKLSLVQGNAFLTSVYTNLQPTFFGGAFLALAPVTFKAGSITSGVSKYRVTINNGDSWLIYVFANNGGASTMTLTSSTLLTGPAGFSGVIQIAKLPNGASSSIEAVYDAAAGTYATQNVLSGSAVGTTGSYTFDFQPVSLAGNPLLSFLYPHLQQSVTSGVPTSLQLWSNTKGLMTAYTGNSLTFTESNLPVDIQFLPWSPLGNLQNYSADALQAIAAAANVEANQVMSGQTNLDSMYFSGKAFGKFAQVCLTLNDVLKTDATSCVKELEQNLATFINNQNIYPLVYDTVWKGVMSSCGNSGCDFGNAVYNDHHFHYGYFVYTAAVIGHIDPSWLTTKNKAWINTLVRDFANPSTSDTAFPQFRNFDWYAGHSWAHGIIAAGDGKDEESSSEDYNAIYGMKLWGKVIGDSSMEARGNLMLSVMRRSMQSYMLMAPDNTVEPSQFVPQYVAGITFMNKIDHTTYFGAAQQYIQGIHMIPLTPISAFIRTPSFVAQEWSAVIKPILSGVTDGWLGILMANLAISDSTTAYKFFSSPSFSNSYLDGGASLTWYLTYAAGMGGAGNFQLGVGTSNGQVTTTTAAAKPTTTASGTTVNLGSSISQRTSSSTPAVQVTTSQTSKTTTSSSAAPSASSSGVTLLLNTANGMQIACGYGALIVGNSASPITVYKDGSLSCGGYKAFVVPQSQAGSYGIYLVDAAPASTVPASWSISGSALSVTIPAANGPATLVYGTDNIIRAVAVNQAISGAGTSIAPAVSITPIAVATTTAAPATSVPVVIIADTVTQVATTGLGGPFGPNPAAAGDSSVSADSLVAVVSTTISTPAQTTTSTASTTGVTLSSQSSLSSTTNTSSTISSTTSTTSTTPTGNAAVQAQQGQVNTLLTQFSTAISITIDVPGSQQTVVYGSGPAVTTVISGSSSTAVVVAGAGSQAGTGVQDSNAQGSIVQAAQSTETQVVSSGSPQNAAAGQSDGSQASGSQASGSQASGSQVSGASDNVQASGNSQVPDASQSSASTGSSASVAGDTQTSQGASSAGSSTDSSSTGSGSGSSDSSSSSSTDSSSGSSSTANTDTSTSTINTNSTSESVPIIVGTTNATLPLYDPITSSATRVHFSVLMTVLAFLYVA